MLVGVVGPVAVGKSTFAAQLAEQLVGGSDVGSQLGVEVVSTDSFLLSNDQLAPIGGAMVKGYPESYDWAGLDSFLVAATSGAEVLSTPVYSHDAFDLAVGERREFVRPDVLIVEGLNLLQVPPGGEGTSPADRLDHSFYLHAPTGMIEDWFVERFGALAHPADGAPTGFYAMFADMDAAELDAVARWTWSEINAPNLRDHIEPTRSRAQVVLHMGSDHRIERVEGRAI